MQIHLLFFGAFGDAMAEGRRDIVSGMRIADVAAQLAAENSAFDALYQKKGSRVAVNQNIVTADHALNSGDILAFLAPVSGG